MAGPPALQELEFKIWTPVDILLALTGGG